MHLSWPAALGPERRASTAAYKLNVQPRCVEHLKVGIVRVFLHPNRFLNRDRRPPLSMRCCPPPVHAGCVVGSISRVSLAPGSPKVERVWKVEPSFITTVISW